MSEMTAVFDEAEQRFHVRRPARRPTPENPFEYYDRYDGSWNPSKSLVLDAFRSAEHARAFAGRDQPEPDRGETDRVLT